MYKGIVEKVIAKDKYTSVNYNGPSSFALESYASQSPDSRDENLEYFNELISIFEYISECVIALIHYYETPGISLSLLDEFYYKTSNLRHHVCSSEVKKHVPCIFTSLQWKAQEIKPIKDDFKRGLEKLGCKIEECDKEYIIKHKKIIEKIYDDNHSQILDLVSSAIMELKYHILKDILSFLHAPIETEIAPWFHVQYPAIQVNDKCFYSLFAFSKYVIKKADQYGPEKSVGVAIERDHFIFSPAELLVILKDFLDDMIESKDIANIEITRLKENIDINLHEEILKNPLISKYLKNSDFSLKRSLNALLNAYPSFSTVFDALVEMNYIEVQKSFIQWKSEKTLCAMLFKYLSVKSKKDQAIIKKDQKEKKDRVKWMLVHAVFKELDIDYSKSVANKPTPIKSKMLSNMYKDLKLDPRLIW